MPSKLKEYQNKYERDVASLKHLLEEADYKLSLKAIEFARPLHSGLRKDNKTPEFHHQVEVALSVYDDRRRLINAGLNVDVVICAAILHDTLEDISTVSFEVIKKKFGCEVADICRRLDKKHEWEPVRDPKHKLKLRDVFPNRALRRLFEHGWDLKKLSKTLLYYNHILESEGALVVKLHDRRGNIHTIDSYTPEKQAEYVVETRMFSAVAKQAVRLNLYPKLVGLIQYSRRQMRYAIDWHLRYFQRLADDMWCEYGRIIPLGKTGEIAKVLLAQGLIRDPRLSHPCDWLQCPLRGKTLWPTPAPLSHRTPQ
ncbi:MAG: HD domain-containing protein [Alphaproteobacteria bacterium]|nr:HD domain-containing protein [Alphaproteobacteria bacterium]